jgi:hypothetical protein
MPHPMTGDPDIPMNCNGQLPVGALAQLQEHSRLIVNPAFSSTCHPPANVDVNPLGPLRLEIIRLQSIPSFLICCLSSKWSLAFFLPFFFSALQHIPPSTSTSRTARTSSTEISVPFPACRSNSSTTKSCHKRSLPSPTRRRPSQLPWLIPREVAASNTRPPAFRILEANAHSRISRHLLEEPFCLRSQRLRFPSL